MQPFCCIFFRAHWVLISGKPEISDLGSYAVATSSAFRVCLVVFRSEGSEYFKLSRKLVLGRRRRRRRRRPGAKCLRQQRSDKLEIIVRLLLAQFPDPARAMTREIGLEHADESFPEGAVATSAVERAVAYVAIETSGHGLAPLADWKLTMRAR